jgi:hypothetical protein
MDDDGTMLAPVTRPGTPQAPGSDFPPNVRAEPHDGVRVVPPVAYAPSPLERARSFLKKHGRKIWWLHSVYALGLGITVVIFARKGFDHARWLAVSVGGAWLLVVLFFRLFGSGRQQARMEVAGTKHRLRFFAMTYVLKNLYQGMLFFLLPFYWKSTTFLSPNGWFIGLLGACALLSTLDVVFDRVLLRFRALASVFHAVALFGCMNLVVPALVPETRTVVSLVIASIITVASFWTIHIDLKTFRDRRWVALCAASFALAAGLAYAGRVAIPAVPTYVAHGAVGPIVLDDGRLGMEVSVLRPTVIDKLVAITDIVAPGGKGDRLVHVWRHDGGEVQRATETTARVDGPQGTIRLRSTMTGRQLPAHLVGSWAVDVETQDGQLVGRVSFAVAD